MATLHGFAHDVHVEDLFGKYMRLKYKATHPADAEILKLDGVKDAIDSLVCDDDAANTIEIQLVDDASADALYNSIHEVLTAKPPREYYVAGSYKWLCRDKATKRYQPIIRRVTSVQLDTDTDTDTSTLILSSEYAKYTDLFESLDLEFVTNAKLSHSATTSTKSVTSCRRLLWWSDIWDDITSSGVQRGEPCRVVGRGHRGLCRRFVRRCGDCRGGD